MNNDYLINYKNIAEKTIEEIIIEIKGRNGLRVSECLISHLVYFENKPILYGNGVYIFKNGHEIIYVGSCVARNFVERIPAHLDVRETAWMNSLPRNIRKRKKMEGLEEAVKYAFENCSLLLINFENDGEIIDWKTEIADKIKKLEFLLVKELDSYNNKDKKYNSVKHKRLDEYLNNESSF